MSLFFRKVTKMNFLKKEISRIAHLFLQKSSVEIYDLAGEIIQETDEEKKQRAPWSEAYDTSILIIGGQLSQIKEPIIGFQHAHLFRAQYSMGEYYFVINKYLEILKTSKEYHYLLEQGFQPENCLANIQFIQSYVDKLRKI